MHIFEIEARGDTVVDKTQHSVALVYVHGAVVDIYS